MLLAAVAVLSLAMSAPPPRWSRPSHGALAQRPALLADGALLYTTFSRNNPSEHPSVEARDARRGAFLWRRSDAAVIVGAEPMLALGRVVARVDARSGRVRWRSQAICPAHAQPTIAAHIGVRLFVGCTGGTLAALDPATGRRIASAQPAALDAYDRIFALDRTTIGLEGSASGAYLYRQSAIVRAATLAPIVALGPDLLLLGSRGERAFIDDVCCQGLPSDSAPGTLVERSLASGASLASVPLHPYAHALAPDRDLPGAGPALLVDRALYVATHDALFAYSLDAVTAPPALAYGGLAATPEVLDGRYLLLQRPHAGMLETSLVDPHDRMRTVWRADGRWRIFVSVGSAAQLVNDASPPSSVVVSATTGASAPIADGCQLLAADGSNAFVACLGSVARYAL